MPRRRDIRESATDGSRNGQVLETMAADQPHLIAAFVAQASGILGAVRFNAG